jgi:hypothetical protein
MESKPNKIQINNQKMIEREELEKLNAYNPFGKGGSGAPNRDHFGNIVTVRKTIANDNVFEPTSRIISGRVPELNNNIQQSNRFHQPQYTPVRPNRQINDQNNMHMENNVLKTMPLYPTYTPYNIQPKYYYNYNDYFNPKENIPINYVPQQHREIVPNNFDQHKFISSRNINTIKQNETITQYEEPTHLQNGGTKPETDSDIIHNKKIYYQSILKQQIEEKRQRDELRKKQDEEMDRMEEIKYNEYLYFILI